MSPSLVFLMQITLRELVDKIRTARAVMSKHNAHRLLLGQCEEVILQLVEQLRAMETQAQAEQKRIILP